MTHLAPAPQNSRFSTEEASSLATVLALMRSGTARTRSELVRHSGFGRTVIAERVEQLLGLCLVRSDGLEPSAGGRPPERLRFHAERGTVLVALLGATSLAVGLTDLSGRLFAEMEQPIDVADGPQQVLDRLYSALDRLIRAHHIAGKDIWGVGVGLPGPVEFATGRPSAPPIMPGWDGYPIRDALEHRYQAPAWVDNEVNTLALGELRVGLGKGCRDMVYIKIGTGIGAGLVSAGNLHRGAKGCAGDIGHTAVTDDASVACRCGKTGCLEALAGGAAVARDGELLARNGKSLVLAKILSSAGELSARDVATAASHGDAEAMRLLTLAGRRIGESLATLVSFFNPSILILGGGLTRAGDNLLAVIRETVYRRSLPLATRDLTIVLSTLGDRAGLIGASFMVTDELFAPDGLMQWVDAGSPFGLRVRTDRVPVTTS